MSPTAVPAPRLEVIWDRPPIQDFSHPYMIAYLPGPKSKLLIYGEHEFVARLADAMNDELEKIRDEIGS